MTPARPPFRFLKHLLQTGVFRWSHRVRSLGMLTLGAIMVLGLLSIPAMATPASASWQSGQIGTPAPESASESSVVLEVSSPAGKTLARTDSRMVAQAATPYLTLKPNEHGWPDFNPLIWSATLICPAGGPNCTHSLTMKHYSNDGGRFLLYGTPSDPDIVFQQIIEMSGQYTMRSFTAMAPSVTVQAGTQRVLQWAVWYQPSPASTIIADLVWGGLTSQLVTVERMRIHPLVFIPGILGTMPPTYDRAGAMEPILRTYEPLLTQMQLLGYELDRSLFPFSVNWRDSIEVVAGQLSASIPGILQTANQSGYVGEPASGPPAAKIDIVGHSMGGLITRTYVEGDAYHGDIDKVVFIASPHRGFPDAYLTREGLTWRTFLDDNVYESSLGGAMDRVLWPIMIGKRYAPSLEEQELGNCQTGYPYEEIKYFYPFCSKEALYNWSHDSVKGVFSLRDMLPDETVDRYLTCGDTAGGECAPGTFYPFGRETNPLLDGPDGLNSPGRLQKLADRLGLQNIYVLFGTGTPTNVEFAVVKGGPPMWAHGEPVLEVIGDGDGLVPSYSADLSQILPGIPAENVIGLDGPQARHKPIMYNPNVIAGYLPSFLTGAWGLPPTAYSQFPPDIEIVRLMVFVGQCPVNLTVTDPQGRRIGYDPSTGGTLQGIPGAVYSGPNVEGQFIIITDPLDGTYQLDGTAFAEGQYLLSADRFTADGLVPLAFFGGNVVTGDALHFEVDSGPVIPPTPTDTATPTDIATSTDTPTATSTPTDTATPTSTPTDTPTPTATATPTNTPSPTATATPTNTPSPSATPTPTSTPTPTLLAGLDELERAVRSYVSTGAIARQLEQSLLAKIGAARSSIQREQYKTAANQLSALVHEIEAQKGKKISEPAAAYLIPRAQLLIRRLAAGR